MGRVCVIFLAVLSLSTVSVRAVPQPDLFDEVPIDLDVFGAAGSRAFVPSQGTVNALLIFAGFQDGSAGSTIPDFAENLFDPAYPGSFFQYYDAMSFGRLQVRGAVLPKRYTSAAPASAYVATRSGEKGRYGDFVDEILTLVDADSDLGAFDNDGPDGVPNSGDDDARVDYVFILLSTIPDGFLLGGADGIAGLGTKFRSANAKTPAGKRILVSGINYHGTIMEERNFAQTVGLMAHEFGHSLGLPDLYDLSFRDEVAQDPADDSAGIGCWGLMGRGALGCHPGDGPSPLSAWSRQRLGWMGSETISYSVWTARPGGCVWTMSMRVGRCCGWVSAPIRTWPRRSRNICWWNTARWRATPSIDICPGAAC